LSAQRSLGGILGATLRRLTYGPFLTYEFGAHPVQSCRTDGGAPKYGLSITRARLKGIE
jgi:hypothetical protein